MVIMGPHLSPSHVSRTPPASTLAAYSLGAHCSLRYPFPQKLASPGKDVSTKHATNDVPKVGDIVDIREGTGDEHILFPSHRQPGRKGGRK